jgi:hypothetical protein
MCKEMLNTISSMKHLIIVLIFMPVLFSFAQQDNMSREWKNRVLNDPNLQNHNFKDSFALHNFSSLWMKTDNQYVFGFIGNNFERIRVKFISVKQDSTNLDTYHIVGKSMVKNNICDFEGTIVLERIAINKKVEVEYKSSGVQSQGFIVANYYFEEDSTQLHSGVFQGSLISLWYINANGIIQYDDLIMGADAFRNNQFIGVWQSYTKDRQLICNWGDYRISNSGNLDIGAGSFSPSDAHLQFGWQNYRDAYFNNDDSAYAIEKKRWWE